MHQHTHTGLIRGHSHLTLMIPGLIHTHISRLCVYQRASQRLSTVPLLPLCPQWGMRPAEPFNPFRSGAKMRSTTSAFNTTYSMIQPCCSHALIRNTKTARQRKGRRGREVSKRRAIKTARSQVRCVVCERVCVHESMCIFCFKRKGIGTPAGAPSNKS